jgi:hypothetical protein
LIIPIFIAASCGELNPKEIKETQKIYSFQIDIDNLIKPSHQDRIPKIFYELFI